MRRRLSLLFAGAVLLLAAWPAQAQTTITVSNSQPELEFPDRLTFRAGFKSDRPIERVVLEYGVDQWTCGTVSAKAFPDITPGQDVSAEWTWEMKQSGSQPPGSKIWWRWRLTDDQGQETVTSRQETVWLDDRHDWQTVSGGNIHLHWYEGGSDFGAELHAAAVEALDNLAQTTGLRSAKPIDLYIYGNFDDMRDAVLYEPGWTGGLAYADHNIVLIGIAPDQLEWGKRTEAHELTHVLVGQLTFSCLSDIPTWLQEGLAVYGEGGWDTPSQTAFEQAVKDDTLLSVRALNGGFSEDPAKADISYSQSYSLVKFLIDEYGQEKMLSLLGALRAGAAAEDAVQQIYGFDLDGFEDAWRAAIDAQPRTGSASTPTPTPQPTEVPTFEPASLAQDGPAPAPTRARPSPTPIAVAAARSTGETTSPATAPPDVPDTAPTAAPAAVPANIIVPVLFAGVVGLVVIVILVLLLKGRSQRMDL
jgi:hypothetical protein